MAECAATEIGFAPSCGALVENSNAATNATLASDQQGGNSCLLTRITPSNASSFPPPSLNQFRGAAARQQHDAAPVVWFRQMTGTEWQRDSHSYDLQTKAYRRMLADNSAAEQTRDRSDRVRSDAVAADGLHQKKMKRAAQKRARDEAELEEIRARDRACAAMLEPLTDRSQAPVHRFG